MRPNRRAHGLVRAGLLAFVQVAAVIAAAAFAAASTSTAASAAAAAAEEATKMLDRPARTSSRDVKIPRALVQKIDKEYRAFLTKNEVSNKSVINRQLLNISAELTQKKTVALHDEARILTPLGGGVVDLSEFVTPLRGAFWLKFLAHKEDGNEPTKLRIFFVSKAKTRIIDGEEYGAGCGKFMEITSYLQKKNSKRGLELYSAGQRYLSVLGGTFVAVGFEKEALYVGSLSFSDSRYPELLCE